MKTQFTSGFRVDHHKGKDGLKPLPGRQQKPAAKPASMRPQNVGAAASQPSRGGAPAAEANTARLLAWVRGAAKTVSGPVPPVPQTRQTAGDRLREAKALKARIEARMQDHDAEMERIRETSTTEGRMAVALRLKAKYP
jgi:hypothetical protein